MRASSGRLLRRSLLSLWAWCAAGACATNPVTKNVELALVSEGREIEMGRAFDRSLVAAHEFYTDSTWQDYLERIGSSLVARCERPDLPWTFRMLDDGGVNAFALPGGIVYVTRGLLVHLNSEAQLAAVMGHEIGHVAARHAVGRITRRDVAALGLVAAVVVGTPAGYAGAVGWRALLSTNSRHAEQQADDLGLHYMSDAGYDPMEMVAALRMVERAFDSGPLPPWRSTHPSPEQRIGNILEERFTLRSYGTVVEHNAYVKRVDGLPYGANQRRRHVTRNRLVIPDGGLQLTFPWGWTVRTEGRAYRAVSLPEDAVVELLAVDQPSADSAARVFFKKLGKALEPPTPDRLNGLVAVTAPFEWLPLWVKMRGSVSFVEYRGAVYRVMGYAKNNRWSAYQAVVEKALRTFEPIPPSDPEIAEPLRVATFALEQPTSLAALLKTRPASVDSTQLALINQVTLDSLLPAGHQVKWVVGIAPQ